MPCGTSMACLCMYVCVVNFSSPCLLPESNSPQEAEAKASNENEDSAELVNERES